jgi:hypothetical protein
MIKNKDDNSLMFMRFDKSDVTGVFSHDGYVDVTTRPPAEAAELIIQRVLLNDQEGAQR